MATTDPTTDRVQTEEHRPDPEPLAGLTGFERDLLFTIARLEGTNPAGVAIGDEIEAHYGEEINRGRLYQNLRRLVDAGRVRTLPLDGRTKVYRLADPTRERLVAHLDWERECLVDDEETGDGGADDGKADDGGTDGGRADDGGTDDVNADGGPADR